MKICKVSGCEKKHDALGYCQKHYRRFKKHGDHDVVLRLGNPIYSSLDEYFAKNTMVEDSGCIVWTKALFRAGYGHVGRTIWSKRYKIYTAHRMSYFHHKGEIPEGMLVLHKCDNPKCVNIDHLFLGTHSDNSRDMAMKGRSFQSQGERNPWAKLSKEEAVFIFNQRGLMSVSELGKKFNVTHSTIRNIWHKKTKYIE